MTDFNQRRTLGPIVTQMGGDTIGSGSAGSGSSNLTITNNVDGYILKATGENDRIEGIPSLQYDSDTATLSASSNLYLTGSANYLYLHGYGAGGEPVKFRVSISGSLLRVDD